MFIMQGSVIDQDINTLISFDRAFNHFFTMRFAPQVAGDEQATAIVYRLNYIPGFPRIDMFIQVGDGDIGAFFSEKYSHGPPNTAVPTSDQYYFIIKFSGTFMTGPVENGAGFHS